MLIGSALAIPFAAGAVHAFGVGDAPEANAAGSTGDLSGSVVGFQGWFACKGDGSAYNAWPHWTLDDTKAPSPSNSASRAWPDTRGIDKTYKTDFVSLGNGEPAVVYSSFDQQTVDAQFASLQENSIGTVAVGRFDPKVNKATGRDLVPGNARNAAEKTGRKFYISYDISGWTAFATELPADWTDRIVGELNLTSSSAYARQDGKLVVEVWGLGLADRPDTIEQCLTVINFLKQQGCHVVGGVDHGWRYGARDGFLEKVFTQLDSISPWMIGVIGDMAGPDWAYQQFTVPDMAWCKEKGINYLPCIMPGDLSLRQRHHGEYMWRQFYNMARAGCSGAFISMFDEYGEGNQIAATAETQADVPVGSGLLALDEDGTKCSSDYYVRLTGDGGRMLKGEMALTEDRPTQPMVGSGTGVVTKKVISLTAAVNDRYVCAENSGSGPLIANRAKKGPWEAFDLITLSGGDVALKSHANGMYVTADNAGASPLVANRSSVGLWETFQFVTNSDGTVSLKAAANGKYVTSEDAGASPLIANRATIGPWESFNVINL
jgi:hypothetical protein